MTRGYTKIVPDFTKAMLQADISGHNEPASLINSNGWRGYDYLVDIGFDKYFQVAREANEFARGNGKVMGSRVSGTMHIEGGPSLTA